MRWVEENGEEALLPGVNYTQTQLFFLNFAQVGCLLSLIVADCVDAILRIINFFYLMIRYELDCGTRRGANSRQPLDRLQYVFALCDPVTLTFDLSTRKPYHL